MAARKKAPAEIYQLKITLADVSPPIWRRVLVPANLTLEDLHELIQSVMGWDGGHLHQFTIGGVEYGSTDPDFGLDGEVEDERKYKLNALVTAKSKIHYVYDFGDNWEHQIVVEKVLPPEPDQLYPVCVAGARNGPPDDCGGAWGYQSFLEAIANPKHPEHEEMLEWSGGEFDPEAFDLKEINERLGH